ncbi:MAG: FtsW/RodA/SpoVE family cell cycle protein [Hyphomicrobiales bacterium]
MASRIERGPLADWWWTVDRTLLVMFVMLMLFGVLASLAGSPPVAERLNYGTFHFVIRQMIFVVPAAMILVVTSFLSPRYVRRVALLVYLLAMALIVYGLIYGVEIKGARRWISIAGMALQPSEFLKPAFVILLAWAFSEGGRRSDVPANFIGLILLPITAVPIVLQPDIGQTGLISIVWIGLVFLSGLNMFSIGVLMGIGCAGIYAAYLYLPHVTARIDRFFNPASGDTFQIDNALRSFTEGGWYGKGPGEGTVKRILPDSHTDFVFAVTAEEFGIIVCMVLLFVFMLTVMRGLILSRRSEEPFARLAGAGLIMLFGVQSCINMAVNVHLIPAKGMTLPFISYGGSSIISLALGMGFLLAVVRKRPRAEYIDALGVTPRSGAS